MLVADVAHKVLRIDTVLDFFYKLQEGYSKNNWKEVATEQLIGQIVLTRYNNRTYRIDDIAWNMTPNSTFTKRSGEALSYVKYYAVAYNKTISELEQPLLVHKHKRKGHPDEIIFLVPELCSMTGISEDMRADFHVMADISQHTRVFPSQRGAELQKFVSDTKKNEKVAKELDQWGFQISSNMLEVPGRVLPPEKIFFRNKQITVDPKTEEWSALCKGSQVISSIPMQSWLLVYTNRNAKLAAEFSQNLFKAGNQIGFDIGKPQLLELRDDKSRSFVDSIKKNLAADIQFVTIILPTPQADRYDSIKQICCLELPVPSQCILAKNLSNPKKVMSVCQNITRQINCKLGGELWTVDIPLRKTMIVGIDVYHDTLTKGQSACGFSASMNQTFTKYFTPVHFQKTGQELVDGLKRCMKESLQQFFILNKHLPEIIIVYRDGVGDGMLQAVVDHEVPQFIETFPSFGENYKPRLCFIVVKKRIHTRMFAKTPQSLENPPPGTIVDSGCVHKDWYDFFLVSQSVRQGTVTPTHYHVVFDTTGIAPDYIQMLTYKMCHLYYNWAGTIRVPAPCQNAHKVAYLAGKSLHKAPGKDLSHRLYYL
jgi:aubergine-like protein